MGIPLSAPNSPEPINQFWQSYAEGRKLNDHLTTLEEEYLPYQIEETQQFLDELSGQIDYSKVVADMPNLFDQIYYLWHAQKQLPGIGLYQGVVFMQKSIAEQAAQWEQAGILQARKATKEDASIGDQSEEDETSLQKDIELLERMIPQLKEYQALAAIYIYKEGSQGVIPEIKNLEKLAFTLRPRNPSEDSVDSGDVEYDPRFLSAASRFIRESVIHYQKEGKILQAPDIEEEYIVASQEADKSAALRQVRLEGFEKLGNRSLDISEETIAAYLDIFVPTHFLQAIRSLKLSDSPPLDNPDARLGGLNQPLYDESGNYLGSEITIYKSAKSENGERDNLDNLTNFLTALTHEIGHTMHRRITYKSLKEWEEILANEQEGITRYSEIIGRIDQNAGKREEFADTIRLFLNKPAVLQIKSPARFEYMQVLFNNHQNLPEREYHAQYIDQLIQGERQAWAASGITEEQVKAYQYF